MIMRFGFTTLAAGLLALVLTKPVCAQVGTTDMAPAPTPTNVTAGSDSARVSAPVVPDSVRRTARLFGLKMTKPAKAGLLAALLPSAGQIYNRSWWKLPLVYGAVGGTLYGQRLYQSRYREFATVYNNRTDNDPNNNNPEDESERTRGRSNDFVKGGVIVYRRQRDAFIGWVALTYSMQILDAVVDAHLRDFDISDDLALHWEPTMLRVPGVAAVTPGVGVTLTLK